MKPAEATLTSFRDNARRSRAAASGPPTNRSAPPPPRGAPAESEHLSRERHDSGRRRGDAGERRGVCVTTGAPFGGGKNRTAKGARSTATASNTGSAPTRNRTEN